MLVRGLLSVEGSWRHSVGTGQDPTAQCHTATCSLGLAVLRNPKRSGQLAQAAWFSLRKRENFWEQFWKSRIINAPPPLLCLPRTKVLLQHQYVPLTNPSFKISRNHFLFFFFFGPVISSGRDMCKRDTSIFTE